MTPDQILSALCVAALAALILGLMESGRPLEWYSRALDRMEHTAPDWIAWAAKPLGKCGFCFTFWFGAACGIALNLTPFQILFFACIVNFINEWKNKR